MNVTVYARPGCERGALIKGLLEEKGVAFREEPLRNGALRGRIGALTDDPVTVIDGERVAGLDRVRIEQLIGWQGF